LSVTGCSDTTVDMYVIGNSQIGVNVKEPDRYIIPSVILSFLTFFDSYKFFFKKVIQ